MQLPQSRQHNSLNESKPMKNVMTLPVYLQLHSYNNFYMFGLNPYLDEFTLMQYNMKSAKQSSEGNDKP